MWRLRVFVGTDPTTGNRRQLSRTVRGGARRASTELARFVTEVEAGEVPMGADQKLGDFLDAWLEFVEPLRSPTTVRGYRDKVRRWKAALGGRKVSKLTAQDLDRTYAKWLDEGAASATVRHCHRVLASALRQAQRWGLVSRCVTDAARPPAAGSRATPEIDPALWQAVVLYLRGREPVTAMAVLLAGVTGARRGELCGLRWSDIDSVRGQIMIARSIRHALDKTQLVVATTKTGGARRVSVDGRTLDLLTEYRRQAERWAEEAGVAMAPEGYRLLQGRSDPRLAALRLRFSRPSGTALRAALDRPPRPGKAALKGRAPSDRALRRIARSACARFSTWGQCSTLRAGRTRIWIVALSR